MLSQGREWLTISNCFREGNTGIGINLFSYFPHTENLYRISSKCSKACPASDKATICQQDMELGLLSTPALQRWPNNDQVTHYKLFYRPVDDPGSIAVIIICHHNLLLHCWFCPDLFLNPWQKVEQLPF